MFSTEIALGLQRGIMSAHGNFQPARAVCDPHCYFMPLASKIYNYFKIINYKLAKNDYLIIFFKPSIFKLNCKIRKKT